MGTRELCEAAARVRIQAHAPYSHFLVGAAVFDEHGQTHIGCNVENAAYPQGICAEASALAAMVAAGSRRCVEIAVSGVASLTTPCGGCLQRLREFGDGQTAIHVCDGSGKLLRTFLLDDLLPFSFGPENLEARE